MKKKIKISSFYAQNYFKNDVLYNLNNRYDEYDFEYVEDNINNKCDIIFYEIFNGDSLINIFNWFKKISYSPIYIYINDDHPNYPNYCTNNLNEIYDTFNKYRQNNYSISYFADSDTNLYFPYYVDFDTILYAYKEKQKFKLNLLNKKNFATWIASNYIEYRKNIVDYISNNYKKVDYFGRNSDRNIPINFGYNPYRYYLHQSYKFNIAIENTFTSGNIKYITEKIQKGYIDNIIPIYYGCSDITDIFNKNSFINLNGLNYDQMIERIREVDENNELYTEMFYQYPFKDKTLNYREYFDERKYKFLKRIFELV